MKLIIPMAGKGTRLRPHSHTTPKPLLPVAGVSVVERIVQTFKRTLDANITEIAYVLGDFGDEVKEQLTSLSKRNGADSRFFYQDEALGTAHAVYCAADALEGEVIVVFADTLFDTNEKVSVEGADSVIWLKEVEDPSRFGVAVEEGDKITGFVEKPSEPISNLAIIGVYYFKQGEELRKHLKYLLDNNIRGHGDEFQLTDAIDRMLKEGKVFKPATVDEWLDCGTIPAWLDTSRVIIDKEFSSADYKEINHNTRIHPPVHIGEGARIEGSELGPYTSIGRNAVIKNSKLGNCILQDDAQVENSSLDRSTIGKNTEVSNAKGEIHIGDHSKLNLS